MRLVRVAAAFILALASAGHAASNLQPAPPGAPPGAPPQFTSFSNRELIRGFMALAFGSDLRIGAKPKGIRRFDHPVAVFIDSSAGTDRRAAMRAVVDEYGHTIPNLTVTATAAESDADVIIHLIDEKDFRSALERSFGAETARQFVARTDPQCMTSVQSQGDGIIVRSTSFIIADQGDGVFYDCAYHELLHTFGLSSHDQRNPWTMLNQNRTVGYLDVYDRALLTLLYDARLAPGMNRREVRKLLPSRIESLGLVRH